MTKPTKKQMKLVLIYGPPASEKLTVAKELSKITNLKVFHNHMVNDIVTEYIEFDKGNFWDYVDKLKKVIYRMAIKEKINLVTTLCYSYGEDDKEIKKMIRYFKRRNSQIYFVRLSCDKKELFKRAREETRKKYGKLKNTSKLKEVLKEREFLKPIPFVDSLTIDNTNLSAKKAANKIKKELGLK